MKKPHLRCLLLLGYKAPTKMGQSWSRLQQHRNAATLLELAPAKTPGHDSLLPSLDRFTLLAALRTIAVYLAKKKRSVTVVAVGGAVNTIYLESRQTTHDVDFFNNRLTPTDVELLVKGAKEAIRRDARLDETWFNNRTILFIPQDQREALTNEAFDQHEVIFSEGGLTVLAAPWQYAFCCKVDRISGGGINSERVYDRDDAVQYLNRYLTSRGETSVLYSTVRQWFVQYLLRWTSENDSVVLRVNTTYRDRFKLSHDAIVFDR